MQCYTNEEALASLFISVSTSFFLLLLLLYFAVSLLLKFFHFIGGYPLLQRCLSLSLSLYTYIYTLMLTLPYLYIYIHMMSNGNILNYEMFYRVVSYIIPFKICLYIVKTKVLAIAEFYFEDKFTLCNAL